MNNVDENSMREQEDLSSRASLKDETIIRRQDQSKQQQQSGCRRCLYLLAGLLLLIGTLYIVIEAIKQSNTSTINQLKAQHQESVKKLIQQLQRTSDKLGEHLDKEQAKIEEITKADSEKLKEREERLSQLTSKMNLLVGKLEQMSADQNELKSTIKIFTEVQEQLKPKETLYSPTELGKKSCFQEKLLQLLSANQQLESILRLHRFSFSLNDSAQDSEALPSPQWMVDYASLEDELPMCVIVPRYINAEIFAIEHSLNSIFRQNYSNYLAVIYRSDQEKVNKFVSRYLRVNNISASNYKYIKTGDKKAALQRIHDAVHNHCPNKSFGFVLEAGSSFMTRNVLKQFNGRYNHYLYGIIWSNHFQISPKFSFAARVNSYYPSKPEISDRSYKDKFSFQIFSFNTQVFKEIKASDFKDDSGNSFEAYLAPIVAPLLQLSCGFTSHIRGVHAVLYRHSEFQQDLEREKQALQLLSKRSKYECSAHIQSVKQSRIHYHPVLDEISEPRKQKGGKVTNPAGDVTAIDLLRVDKDGKGIEHILYSTKRERQERAAFQQRRIEFTKGKEDRFPGIQLAKHNIKIDHSLDEVERAEEEKEYNRLNQKYHIDDYKEELPMCLVACSYNNNANFRIEYNLNSIFRQNYSNYFAVIINDVSYDGSDLTYRKYFDFYNISKDKYVYVENHRRKTSLENIYDAIHNYCSEDAIVMLLDADDEIMGKNTIKLFNAMYHYYKGGEIYSNFYTYIVDDMLETGFSSSYTLEEKQNLKFREQNAKTAHLQTFNATLFRSINKTNFFSPNGNFYKITADLAIEFPVMEKACGRIYFVPEVNYLYNGGTGYSDAFLQPYQQARTGFQIRQKSKVQCDPYFQTVPIIPQI